MDDLPRLKLRSKLSDEIAGHLRDDIMSGHISSGQRLALQPIADRLGVSTMPVREALVGLANEGVVKVLPRRGFRVAAVRRKDIEDVFRIHAYVAGQLAEAASLTIGRETIEQLYRIQEDIDRLSHFKLSKVQRAKQIEQRNYEFHRLINRVPEAERLRWFLRAATRYVPRHYYEMIPEWIDVTVADHPAIIRALEEQDASRARDLMVEHVARAGELVITKLASQGFWAD